MNGFSRFIYLVDSHCNVLIHIYFAGNYLLMILNVDFFFLNTNQVFLLSAVSISELLLELEFDLPIALHLECLMVSRYFNQRACPIY